MTNRVALIILDGFGLSAYEKGNAILEARLPFINQLVERYPAVALAASGTEVGLDWGEVGNSEVGHFNIGAGRVVLQDLPRINAAIASGRFFQNEALVSQLAALKQRGKRLHLIGLISNGGVHGHVDHLIAMLKFAQEQGLTDVVVHAITDGRDTQPKVAQKFITQLQQAIKEIGVGQLGTLVGRYYAMDRDNNWDRIELAFAAIVDRKGTSFTDPAEALKAAYAAGKSDESLEPLVNPAVPGIAEQDLIVMTNFRPDRARQLAMALTDPTFSAFKRSSSLINTEFVSFVSYGQEATSRVHVAFFAEPMANYLASELADAQIYQLHVAETEKYAHVTYFLNTGQETPLAGEERILVPSPKVVSYDQRPEMSAQLVASEFQTRFVKPFRFGVVNFANPDMVGHTGNFAATTQAIETLDSILKTLITHLQADNTTIIITADHGNCEQMIHPKTGEIDKEHTVNPVPLILIQPGGERPTTGGLHALVAAQPVGVLADIAPTILEILGLPTPSEMTGQSLLHAI